MYRILRQPQNYDCCYNHKNDNENDNDNDNDNRNNDHDHDHDDKDKRWMAEQQQQQDDDSTRKNNVDGSGSEKSNSNTNNNNIMTQLYLTDGDTDTLARLRANLVHNHCFISTSHDADGKNDNKNKNKNNNCKHEHEMEHITTTTTTMMMMNDQTISPRPKEDATIETQSSKPLRPVLQLSCQQLLWGRDSAIRFLRRNAYNSHNNSNSNCVSSSSGCYHKNQQQQGSEKMNPTTSMPTTNGAFDIIFGSDLIYVERVIAPLFQTVDALLGKPPLPSLTTTDTTAAGSTRTTTITATSTHMNTNSTTNSTGTDSSFCPPCFIMAHCLRRQGNEVTLEKVLDGAKSVGLDQHQIMETDEDDIVLIVFNRKRNESAGTQNNVEIKK